MRSTLASGMLEMLAMMKSDGEVRLTDLVTDENGVPLTEGSSFSELCINYCRKSPIGRKRCEK